MSDTTRFYRPPEVSWTERRWRKLVALIFLVQLGLLFWLDDSVPIPPTTEKAAKFIWMIEEPTPREWEENILVNDPLQFALPNPHGFSGRAWMDSKPPRLAVGDWDEPARFYEAQQAFGGGQSGRLSAVPALSLSSSPLMESKPWPSIGNLPLAVTTPANLQSVLKVVSPGPERSLLKPLQLPVWKSGDLLSNSVVEVTVAAEGHVLGARILNRSGWPAADEWALSAAKRARFSPRPAAGEGGREGITEPIRLIFEWSSSSTNGIVPNPPVN